MGVKLFSNRAQAKYFWFRWRKTKIFNYWEVVTISKTPSRASPELLPQLDVGSELFS
jgi:hypothetical protein